MAKKLRCYVGRHRWQKRRSDDGAMYYECRNCGKVGARTTCQLGATSSILPRPFLEKTVTCRAKLGVGCGEPQHYADNEDDEEQHDYGPT